MGKLAGCGHKSVYQALVPDDTELSNFIIRVGNEATIGVFRV